LESDAGLEWNFDEEKVEKYLLMYLYQGQSYSRSSIQLSRELFKHEIS
jgi:hypothetical protein